MAPAPAARPLVLVWLVAVASLIPVSLVPWPLVTAGLVCVIALVPGWLIGVGLGPRVPVTIGILAVGLLWFIARWLVAADVAIELIAVGLTGNPMLG